MSAGASLLPAPVLKSHGICLQASLLLVMQVPKESLKKLMVHSLPAGVLADALLQLFAAVTCDKPSAVEGNLATEQKGKCCLAHVRVLPKAGDLQGRHCSHDGGLHVIYSLSVFMQAMLSLNTQGRQMKPSSSWQVCWGHRCAAGSVWTSVRLHICCAGAAGAEETDSLGRKQKQLRLTTGTGQPCSATSLPATAASI